MYQEKKDAALWKPENLQKGLRWLPTKFGVTPNDASELTEERGSLLFFLKNFQLFITLSSLSLKECILAKE